MLSLSLPVTLLCGPRRARYPPGLVSNKPFSSPQSSLMVVAEVYLAITVRTTRTGPSTTLAPVGETSGVGGAPTGSTGPPGTPS